MIGLLWISSEPLFDYTWRLRRAPCYPLRHFREPGLHIALSGITEIDDDECFNRAVGGDRIHVMNIKYGCK